MEVSNEIKEDIRKTQSDLKNAIRVHQIWVARLQEDENNILIKTKVKEAEKDIITIGQTQKLVVDRLRKELEMYQQRLKARNKQINIENDNRYVAQQLREHQLQYRHRNRTISLLKPSVLNEIHIKAENTNGELKDDNTDSDNENKSSNEKRYSNNGETIDKYHSYSQPDNTVHHSRSNFANALNKVKESFASSSKMQHNDWPDDRTDSESSGAELSPTPSPPPLPQPGEPVSQEVFMRQAEFSYSRLLGLVTPAQKEVLDKKRSERRKRSSGRTNRAEFIYSNYEMMPKRKKLNQFPYLQSHSDPPQTRSAKLRKQQSTPDKSREGSPSGSSSENNRENSRDNIKAWSSTNKPAWMTSLPAGLSVEPVSAPAKKVCHGCGRSDVPSLLVRCGCGVWAHTGCGAGGGCARCARPLPDPAARPHTPHTPHSPDLPTHAHHHSVLYRDKLAERKRLQEKNIELCLELRKLEARAATLKENLDEHNAEKRQLLANQIKTQRNLQKLLDFISQFKETSISLRSTSLSETGSEGSKSNEE